MSVFDKNTIARFRFVRCAFDAHTGVAQLVYAFDDGPELVETITIPGAPFELGGARAEAVQRALRLLHLIAGVSYYKAAVPPVIEIDGYAIDAATATLLEQVYLNGLGEFAYRNGLNLRGRIRFPATVEPLPPPLAGEGRGGSEGDAEPPEDLPRSAPGSSPGQALRAPSTPRVLSPASGRRELSIPVP